MRPVFSAFMSAFALAGCAVCPPAEKPKPHDIGPFVVPLSAEECAGLGDECVRFRADAYRNQYLRCCIGLDPDKEGIDRE